MAAPVLAHCAANIFRNFGEAANQVVYRLGGEVRMAGQRRVHVVDVCLVMLVVVELHRLRIDKGLERRIVVGEWWKFVRHRGILFVWIVLWGPG